MPSVDDVDFYSLKGHIEPTGIDTVEISRPGVDGHSYRQNAYRGNPFQMVGLVDCDSANAARLKYSDCINLKGSVVPVTDDHGVTQDGVMVEDVRRLDMYPLLKAVGGISSQKGYMLVVGFTMRCTQV